MLSQVAYKIRGLTPVPARRFLSRIGRFYGASLSAAQGGLLPSVEGTLRYLGAWGFEPHRVIDVGAYHGRWTDLLKSVYPNAQVLMVEAQEGKAAILARVCEAYRPTVQLEIALLGAEAGKQVRFVEMETGSSVFEEASAYAQRVPVTKTQTTLDVLLDKHREFVACDFLKLDVQGYELEVLKGARQLLSTTPFVLLEASLIPVNRGCPLLAEVIGFMGERGYRLLDFCSQMRREDLALWQTDLLFVRTDSRFCPEP